MGLPSKRRTSRSKRERNAHAALIPLTTQKCEACGKAVQPHHACPHCGNYRGRKVRT